MCDQPCPVLGRPPLSLSFGFLNTTNEVPCSLTSFGSVYFTTIRLNTIAANANLQLDHQHRQTELTAANSYPILNSSTVATNTTYAGRWYRMSAVFFNSSTNTTTNAFLEGLNSVFSAVKRKARGFRSTKNLITMLYFTAGHLTRYPLKTARNLITSLDPEDPLPPEKYYRTSTTLWHWLDFRQI